MTVEMIITREELATMIGEVGVKLLKPIDNPSKFHVHLDTIRRLPYEAAKLLLENRFAGSCPTFSCAVASSGQNQNVGVTYQTYKNTAPETWTFKTNSRREADQAYALVLYILKNEKWRVKGYGEEEVIGGDAAFLPKEFNKEAYNKLLQVMEGKQNRKLRYGGGLLPANVKLRHPRIMGELEKPTMEFHLTINTAYCDDRLVKLLDAIGLLSYEIKKALYDKDGNPILQDDKLMIVTERPLTIRHSDMSECSEDDFFQLIGLVLHIMTKVGGIDQGIILPDGSEYYAATFKIERLVEFDPFRIGSNQLPPIMDHVIFKNLEELDYTVPRNIAHTARVMFELGMPGGGAIAR